MNIKDILQQIPAWEKTETIRYEPINSGYSNKIYKVFVDDKEYALRINGKQNEYLSLRYEDEAEAMALAAKQNIAPAILPCENQSDFLITEFVDGPLVTIEQMRHEDTIKTIVTLLKKVHALPYSGTRSSTPFSLTRGYLAGSEKLGMVCPVDLKDFLPKMAAIEKTRQKDPVYLKHYCHNDMFTHNMIQSRDGSIKLIDWELSGLGDIWFDLATISFSCGFNPSEDETMLLAYFGSIDDQKQKTLHDMKFVCMIREIGWALLHTAMNRLLPTPGTDYLEFANTVLDRLKQGLVTLI